jgi:tetratricopeptide (TPR) repeat protein
MAEGAIGERQEKETRFMNYEGKRDRRWSAGVLALVAVVLSACATTGPGEPGVAGERPRDDAHTREAGVYLAQASLAQGEAARRSYEQALAAALNAIERDPSNPRAYLLAGQASVGAEQWVRADTMFARAEELHPRFADQILAEREEGWVLAYNLGAEALNAGDMDAALEYFRGADVLYDGRPEARLAVALLYTNRGELEGAIRAYEGALDILAAGVPEGLLEEQIEAWEQDHRTAAFNLANLLSQTDRFAEAAEVLAEYLAQVGPELEAEVRLQALTAQAAFLAQAGRAEEAQELYADLLARPDLGSDQYFQIGIGMFNAGEYERAADAFATSAELNPHSRDAYLNLVQSLYTAAMDLEEEAETPERNQRLHAMYDRLLEAADRVTEFDPLNRNLLSFTLRAYRAKADISPSAEADRLNRMAQDVFRRYQEQPYEVVDIVMAHERGDRARVEGTFMNLTGTPGQQVALRFTILDTDGNAMDTATATVTVPPADEAVDFSTVVDLSRGQLAGWRYELVR